MRYSSKPKKCPARRSPSSSSASPSFYNKPKVPNNPCPLTPPLGSPSSSSASPSSLEFPSSSSASPSSPESPYLDLLIPPPLTLPSTTNVKPNVLPAGPFSVSPSNNSLFVTLIFKYISFKPFQICGSIFVHYIRPINI